MQRTLEGRVALVTGGTRGVGAGIAAVLAEHGARVVVCGRTAPSAPGPCFRAADLRDPASIDALVDHVERTFGRLDLLVNNAGGSPSADFATASPRFVQSVVTLNLLAPMWVSQRCHGLLAAAQGSVVNIASVSGVRPSPGTAAYAAAKAGLLALTRSLAVEWAPTVRVNALVVGLVHTEAAEGHYGGPEGVAAVAETVPAGRLATPRDVGEACAWLASPAAAYVSGAELAVHGGGERPAFLGAVAGPRVT